MKLFPKDKVIPHDCFPSDLKSEVGEGPWFILNVEPTSDDDFQYVSLMNQSGLVWVSYNGKWETREDRPGRFKAIPPTFPSFWFTKIPANEEERDKAIAEQQDIIKKAQAEIKSLKGIVGCRVHDNDWYLGCDECQKNKNCVNNIP